MDGNQRPDASLRTLIGTCALALDELTLPESRLKQIEFWRRLEELGIALATVRTARCGSTPMASDAFERLLLALINVLALRDT
jgi:hypothetical protein